MSPDVAIHAQDVSKLYRIGVAERRSESLLGAVKSAVTTPIRNFRKLSRLNTYGRNGTFDAGEDSIWALKNVSFEVKRGEVLGVIGRNGAGKSTLLKILSRITEPTEGRIRLRGRVSSLLEVGTGFHPELTGRENVYLNGTILGMTRREIDRKFDEIVEFSGVAKFLDTPVKRYSSGMKVRLAFAVAAHLEPEILIVDEVLAVGDADFQRKCVGKMREVSSGQGRTVLFVSHNIGAVQSLCTHGLVLNGGRVVHDGPIDDALEFYSASFHTLKEITLAERTDRLGLGQARLTDVSIVGPEGHPLGSVTTGGRCGFRFTFEASHPLVMPLLTFTVYTHLGQPLMNFKSTFSETLIQEIGQRGTITCHFDKFPLTPGLYRINASLKDRLHVQDHVDGALSFEVHHGDYFAVGRHCEYLGETCLAPHRWDFE